MYDVSAASTEVVYVMCIVCVVYLGARTRSLRVFVKKPSSGSHRKPLLLPRRSRKTTRDDLDLCVTSRRVTDSGNGEHQKKKKKITHAWDFSYTSRRLHNLGSPSAPVQLDWTIPAKLGPRAHLWAINICCRQISSHAFNKVCCTTLF